MPFHAVRSFLRLEAAGGLLLMAAAALAIAVDNSPLAPFYDRLLNLPFTVALGNAALSKPLVLWINDGLMAVFFLLVGLEIKRELAEGHLSGRDQLVLPAACAIGGMAVPAAFYAAVAWSQPEALGGWAIPAATDIAFALGIMALLGSRVPVSLKVLLTAIAVIDDLGAVVIIALFYTDSLSLTALAVAGIALAGLITLNLARVISLAPYVLLGLVLWTSVLQSGVHATLAGVALALAIPLRGRLGARPLVRLEHSLHPWVAFLILPVFALAIPLRGRLGARPLVRLEHSLHPWVAFLILPVFAFANAGLPLGNLEPSALLEAIPLGVAAGLFFGKQLGVAGGAWLAVRTGLARLPEEIGWRQIYGMACLTGIGFTMSLFIGGLAFQSPEAINAVRLGVLVGSLASALLGCAVLMAPGGAKAVHSVK